MGLFLRITYQSQGGRTPETAFKNQKILDEIIDGLNDFDWQESNSTKLTTLDPQYSHIAIGAILRFFLSENIEGGNLKSFYRYLKCSQLTNMITCPKLKQERHFVMIYSYISKRLS